MVKKVKTESELGDALKNKADAIEIEGDLAKKIFKIRATGNVAWVIAIGAVGIAVYGTLATLGTGGVAGGAAAPIAKRIGIVAAPAAVGILGLGTTYTAIAIAIAAGGVGALTRLRGYKQVSYKNGSLVLKRK